MSKTFTEHQVSKAPQHFSYAVLWKHGTNTANGL